MCLYYLNSNLLSKERSGCIQSLWGQWVSMTVLSKVVFHITFLWLEKCHLMPFSSIRSTAKLVKIISLQKPRSASNLNCARWVHLHLFLSLCSQGNSSWWLNCCYLAEKAYTCWQIGSKQIERETSKVWQDSSPASATSDRLLDGRSRAPVWWDGVSKEYRCKSPFFLTDMWSSPTQTMLEQEKQEIPQIPARNPLTRARVPVF